MDLTPPIDVRPSTGRDYNPFKDELQKKIGLSLPVVGNMLRAVVAGRVSPEWAGLVLGGQAFATVRQNLQNEIYKEVLQDPGTATRLLQLMKEPAKSSSLGIRAWGLLKKSPKLLGYFIGIGEYPRLGLQAGLNQARDLAGAEQQQ